MIVLEPPSSGTFPALNRTALSRFLTRAQKAAALDGEVTVLLADDARLKELNRAWRRKNKPTDVLSFPAAAVPGTKPGDGIAGDLAISVETAARQAAEHGHSLDEELRILMLHGVLHLAGMDHEVDGGEMRAHESDLRTKLKLPAGLIERTTSKPRGGSNPTSLQDVGHPSSNKPKKRVPHVSTLRRGAAATSSHSKPAKTATKKRSVR